MPSLFSEQFQICNFFALFLPAALCCCLLSVAASACCLLLPAVACCCLLLPAHCTYLEVVKPGCWGQGPGARGQGPGCAFAFMNWSVSCLLTWHFSVMSSMSSQRIADSLEVHLKRFVYWWMTIVGSPVSWNRVFLEWGMLTDCFLCFPLGLVFVYLLHVCLFFSFGCCCWCLDFLRSISSLTEWQYWS